MNLKKVKIDFSTFLLYVLSFLLFWEWLRPVQHLTDTSYPGVFLGFIVLALLLAYIRVQTLPSFLIKSVYVLYMIHFIYYEGTFFRPGWLITFFKDLFVNLGFIWNVQLMSLSDAFRTLLFFILLWLIAYLIQYWLLKQKRIFVFFFMTIVFITVLDTFSTYEADWAIVRTVIAGFTVMGMLTVKRVIAVEDIPKKHRIIRNWMIPLIAMIAGGAMIGYTVPKADPIWPDPVPFIKSFNADSGTMEGEGVRRSGYGTDDSNLGGPLLGDDTVVFRAEVDEPHYWKVETKDTYTGKGWILSNNEEDSLEFNGGEVPFFSFYENVSSEVKTSTVYNVRKYPHIQYPHGLIEVLTEEQYWYRLNLAAEKVSPVLGLETRTPGSYTVQYLKPTFNVEDLQNSSFLKGDSSTDFIQTKYTQLPDGLPERIKQLALDITADEKTMFDKVQAVENYFHSNGFIYDKVNVSFPEEDEDYVDQFLFDTKRGYCDNFSTSMVVLLRTLDIPARWVKGYTAGEYVETLDSGRRVYEVTNNNAHSWVEVFFPEVGWVPFEPTLGFSDYVEFNSGTIENDPSPKEEETEEATAPAEVEPKVEDVEKDSNSLSFSTNPIWLQQIKDYFKNNWKFLLVFLGVLAVVSAIIYRSRGKWLPHYYIFIYRLNKKDADFPQAYLVLLKQLERFGLKRKQGQTLREYAHYIDSMLGGDEMRQLTDQYERFLYRGTLGEGTWSEMKGNWAALIRKTGA